MTTSQQTWRNATGLGGSTMWVTVEELQQIHDEIWSILERYTDRSDDPSLRPSGSRAARMFFFTAVSPPQAVSVPARLRGGLWRQRDFGLFWTGESISEVGNSVTIVVVPLVAIEILHASTFIVTVLNAAVWLPWLIIGIPAGAWVDRLPPKPVMLTCDAISLPAYASVPVAAWLGVLTVAQLIVVTLTGGYRDGVLPQRLSGPARRHRR